MTTPSEIPTEPTDFVSQLKNLINCHSKENGSDTPDFILAEYLNTCLEAYNLALVAREQWYGRRCGSEKTPHYESSDPITPEFLQKMGAELDDHSTSTIPFPKS